ncbi:MAG: transglycosylase SLT domain-containing protein [Saprospiraceae bacterium]
MKSTQIKGLLASIFTSLFLLLFSINSYANTADYNEYNEEEIRQRVLNLPSAVIKPRYTPAVKSYLRTYTINNREKSEMILGKSILYFELFEKKLRQLGLPEDLKYLSVVESALNPKAVSRAGAVGLWQFMPATGKEYGLNINYQYDDRCDPEKSTEAAAQYLLRAYDRFGDWALALAAYNSGGGRVSRAIKRARSKNFWNIQQYLPRETRNYVPAFIAATYLMHHYDKHGLYPRYPHLDVQITEQVTVYGEMSFHNIAQITGTPMDIIGMLNPSFSRANIPASQYGNQVTLPKRTAPRLVRYLEAQRPDYQGSISDIILHPVYFTTPPEMQDGNLYMQTLYTVQQGENIYDVARIFGFSPYQIQAWNGLRYPILEAGQQVRLYQPRSAVHAPMIEASAASSTRNNSSNITYGKVLPKPAPVVPKREKLEELTEIGNRPIKALEDPFVRKISEQQEVVEKRQPRYQMYKIQKNETLLDIANKFPAITVRDLMILNNYRSHQKLETGEKIKIKKK